MSASVLIRPRKKTASSPGSAGDTAATQARAGAHLLRSLVLLRNARRLGRTRSSAEG
jgi:hypothetical protein